MGLQTGLEAHIEKYIEGMVSVTVSDPEMRHYPPSFIEAVCRSLAYRVRPVVEVVSEEISEEKSRFVFRVVSPPLASYVGGCMGNDTNSHKHTGENAITQSNAIFSICVDTVMRSYAGKGSFTLANPLNFRIALPFGKSVLVTIELGPRKRLTKGTIEATLEESGKPILRKAEINMVRD